MAEEKITRSTGDPEKEVAKKESTKAKAKKSEDVAVDQEIAELEARLKAAYKKKKVTGMTYEEKRDEYGAVPAADNALKVDKSERPRTFVDDIKDEYKELALAANPAKNILTSVEIVGQDKEDNKYGICMLAKLTGGKGMFTIRIPVSELALFDPNDPSFKHENKEDSLKYLTRELDRWIGAVTDVVIYEVDEKTRTALASRLAASAKKAKYLMKDKKFKEGSIQIGTVVSAKRDTVTVSIEGQDVKIKTDEATWTAALPLHEEFYIGQKVNVKILEIGDNIEWEANGHKYLLLNLKGSIKQASPDPQEFFYDDFKIGYKYKATVKAATADGLKVFVVINDKVTVMCNAPLLGELGDTVYVKIEKKEDSTKRIWGTIIKAF